MPDGPSINSHLRHVQQLFVRHTASLRALIYSLLPDRGASMDVLQETFLTVTDKAADYAEGTNFLAWAGAIARYKVLEARRAARFPVLSTEAIAVLCAAPGARPPADPRLDMIRDCIKVLPRRLRWMIEQYYVESKKPAAIAGVIGWTAESVYVTLSKARAAVRKCVERKLAAEGNA